MKSSNYSIKKKKKNKNKNKYLLYKKKKKKLTLQPMFQKLIDQYLYSVMVNIRPNQY